MPLAHGTIAPQPGVTATLGAWPFEPLVWLGIAAAAWWYLRAYARVPAYPTVRRTHFLAGLGAVGVALASPIAVYESSLFWVHMVQHLLLTMVAAPLLLLGAPVTLWLRSAPPAKRKGVLRVLHSRPARTLTHPVVTWCVFALVMWITHFTPLYDLALENEPAHIAEHAAYLGAACLFWWPVIGLEPSRARLGWPGRIVYVLLAMPQQSFLGVAIHQASSPLYSHYETLARPWGPTPLADQRLAGTLMWIAGDFLFIGALTLVVLAWMRHERRATEHLDRRLDLAEGMATGDGVKS
ncbi:MAG: cytochrome c oxidase assembly protein [Actinomycetota bacterium]